MGWMMLSGDFATKLTSGTAKDNARAMHPVAWRLHRAGFLGVPTTDGRELRLVRRTEADRDVALLLASESGPRNPGKTAPPILRDAGVAEVGLSMFAVIS